MSNDPPPVSDPTPASHHSGDSLLDSIGRRSGRVRRTSLDDTDGDEGSPVIDPRVASFQEQLRGEDRGKYRVVGEIASGGMGVVLRGHDNELGRDVAMKVIHEKLADRPEVIDRFVEEAQIGGQLQHPGIVPVYELGIMSDQRPYFTMKLIKGHTLAKLLARRKDVGEDRVRFLSIFESVCQTMAYAHSKSVIHRDLKPANVMVGSFGEVQVVDWGLSKVLGRGGVADELASQDTALTVIETVRSGPQAGSDSIVGNVLGTPAYMSPEQARGEVEQLDERSDVFALGAILCELLTGAPPYASEDAGKLVQMAALAELDEARQRIEGAQTSEELKKLCLACLMPSKRARPRSAEEVAEAVHDHLSGLETAAHEAQLAAAEERLGAERSRRRLQLTLSVGALLFVAGGGWWWMDTQREARLAEIAQGFDHARLETLEREQQGAYAQALDAARGGLRLVEAGGAEGPLLAQAQALVDGAEQALADDETRLAEQARDEELTEFLTEIAMRQVDTGLAETNQGLVEENRVAFAAYGLDLTDPDIGERVEELRDSPMALQVALGADGWAQVLRRMTLESSEEIDLLTSIALDLDPDPLRTDVRLALMEKDTQRLLELAHELKLDEAAPETLHLLASGLNERDEFETARSILTHGADRYPDHFLLNFLAAQALQGDPRDPERYLRTEGYLRAALALRPGQPDICMQLGDFYREVGNYVLASRWIERVFQFAPEINPDISWNEGVLALDYMRTGRYDEALRWLEEGDATQSLEPWEQSLLRSCRVRLGRSTLEEYLAWVSPKAAREPGLWISPAFLLLDAPEVVPLDPARALELLQPVIEADLDSPPAWAAVTIARVLLGDGPGALEALARYEGSSSPRDQAARTIAALLGAAAQGLVGNEREAAILLDRARRSLADLTAGDEEEWAESGVVRMFPPLEAIAEGR